MRSLSMLGYLGGLVDFAEESPAWRKSSVSPLWAMDADLPVRITALVAQSVTRTSVAALRLTNFRNYPSLAVDFDARSVVLTGENGAGKTNILEAVSFLAPGRGLRGARLEEVAADGGDGTWAVAATVINGS